MNPQLDALRLAVAAAERPCSHLHDDGSAWPEKIPDHGQRRCYACVDQATPGMIPLFPGLRKPCPLVHVIVTTGGQSSTLGPATCAEVMCPGWVPVTDDYSLVRAGVITIMEYGFGSLTFWGGRTTTAKDSLQDPVAYWLTVYQVVKPLVPKRFRLAAYD